MKLLALPVTLFLLCGPALADPAPTYKVSVAIASGKEVRRYGVQLVDHACGAVEARTDAAHDEVKLCAHSDPGGVRVEVDWTTHEGPNVLHNASVAVVARGGSFAVDVGSAKLTISLQ